MLLSGLFVATASQSDATPPPACPTGFNLTADQKNCFQNAVVTKADNPNSCAEGQLTPDGSKCYVPARAIPQEGTTSCPTGYSPDDSLGGMCARFEKADQKDPTCPTGARGTAGACYIFVALGPAGAGACSAADVALGGVVAGGQCVITGPAPTPGPGTCPVSTTVFLENGVCFQVISPAAGTTVPCQAPYAMFGTTCKYANPNPLANPPVLATIADCPTAPSTITAETHTSGGISKVSECSYTPASGPTTCTAAADIGLVNGQCRRSVAVVPGAANCTVGFGNIGGKCIRYTSLVVPTASCPLGSVVDSNGDCRKPVADAAGVYYCKDANAALNGKSCVWVTGFNITPKPTQFKCDKGVRTVIGFGDSTRVLCILGDADANLVEGPSCLQGVLSTDNKYCIVPRIDTAPATAAPVPSFTG